jgi:hypothetical protein
MRYTQINEKADLADKLKRDARTMKMLVIAMKHDHSLPPRLIAQMGHKVSPEAAAEAWSALLNAALSNTNFGDLAADGKFDDWLTRLYINGAADYEDISGEAVDALGAWKALSLRGLLKGPHQDFNRYTSIHHLQKVMRNTVYQDEIRKIRDAEKIEKMKRDAVMVSILETDRFSVVVPLNYGACYTRDRYSGYQPNFCTSGSSGEYWFRNYAPQGPIINIQDKTNSKDEWGKWQMHTATNQLVNADQDRRNDREWNDAKFAELFPGLMPQIAQGLQAHAAEIKEASKALRAPDGYDIGEEVARLKQRYPKSMASQATEAPPAATTPGRIPG